MRLEGKRQLVARTLKVGKGRIIFNTQRLSEIKEAITKQDIRDLKEAGVISVREKKGRKKVEKRTTRRRAGSIKKKVKTRKRDYVIMTRKLRAYLRALKQRNKISRDDFLELRKEIRSKDFRSLAHMKERISQLKEEE